MNIKPVNTKKDQRAALKRIEQLWDAKPKSREGDELDILVTLVSAYEDKHFPISISDPVEAIKFRMVQLGCVVAVFFRVYYKLQVSRVPD